MLTYITRFWSGGFEPFWPHVVLLSLSVLASIAVGVGIIFERPKYSKAVHRAAFWLIVGGIGIEAICTIFLFVFDEGISGAQQSTIIALEERLASRWITDDQTTKLVTRLSEFAGTEYDAFASPKEKPARLEPRRSRERNLCPTAERNQRCT
jgi:hypothetical protein